jgi:hypothetical protein
MKHEEERRKEGKGRRKELVMRDTTFITGKQITSYGSDQCPLVFLQR